MSGRLTVISGCMFASKTELLISFLRRESHTKRRVRAFKPAMDTRYATEKIVSHNNSEFECVPFASTKELMSMVENLFGDSALPDYCDQLAQRGFRVYAALLDLDSEGRPFGIAPRLLAFADKIKKVHAQCFICGEDATRTWCKVDKKGQVLVGGANDYEARCRRHWNGGDS
jgi:thymidine kinase